MRNFIFIWIAFAINAYGAYGQVSHGGEPYSWKAKSINDIPLHRVQLSTPDRSKSEAILKSRREEGQAFSYGFQRFKLINVLTEGQWESLPDGSRVCRLAVISPGAAMLSLQFSQFDMEPGAKLFLYSSDRKNFIGSFTEANELPSGDWATSLLPGQEVVVEYHEPARRTNASRALIIESLTHSVFDIFDSRKEGSAKDYWPGYPASPCHNNVVCPIGNAWQDQAKSVAMFLRPDGGGCSGLLLNNTANDGTPYFYLANHCYVPTESQWVFYFNYESPSCIGDTGPTTQTMVGGALRAIENYKDFTLLELFSQPPASFGVYYAGWDATGAQPLNETVIHHPLYDVKKISFDYDPAITYVYTWNPAWYPPGSITNLWGCTWDSGIVEAVSSGAPLFDQNQRMIGHMNEGLNTCATVQNEVTGCAKFADCWNGPAPSVRLRDWLDPGNTTMVSDGYDPNGSPPVGVTVPVIVGLQGPMDPANGLMHDSLRRRSLLPMMEPYTALGYAHVNGGGGEMTDVDMLNTTGTGAPVDWILVEFRDQGNWNNVVATRSGMLLSNGQVVEPDDPTPLTFNVSAGNYYVAIRHRNHLPIITAAPVSISNSMLTLDLTSTPSVVFGGAAAFTQVGALYTMVAGDCSGDNEVKYIGNDNDRDIILQDIGGSVPTNSVTGYYLSDVNLDGGIKYIGSDNDRDMILINIGGSSPTVVRSAYFP